MRKLKRKDISSDWGVQYNGHNLMEIYEAIGKSYDDFHVQLPSFQVRWTKYDGVENTHYELRVGDWIVNDVFMNWKILSNETFMKLYETDKGDVGS